MSKKQEDESDLSDRLVEAAYASLSSDDGFQHIIDNFSETADALTDTSKRGSLLSRLHRHVERASNLFSVLPAPASQDLVETEVLRSAAPAFALSAKLHVVCANSAGSSLFGVRTGGRDAMTWLAPNDRARFMALFDDHETDSILVAAQFDDGLQARVAQAFAVADPAMDGKFVVVRVLEIGWTGQLEDYLRNSFALTAGELEVVRLFLRHPDTEVIARMRDTKPATIRKQLKAVFAKTSTGSQSELLQRLMLLAQARAPQQAAQTDPWSDPLGREKVFVGSSGRRIAYTWMGAPWQGANGPSRPVLLSHGSLTGYLLAPETQEFLREANITVIAPCRPGFGLSDPNWEAGQLTASAQCFNDLLDHLGTGPIPAMGLVSGLVPLIHHAAGAPHRYTRLLSVGGCMPFGDLREKRDLAMNSRVLLALTRNAPRVARLAILGAYRQVQKHGPSWMVSKIYGVGETDIRTISDYSTLAFLTSSARMLTVHGIRAFEHELPLIVYDWEADFQRSGLQLAALQGLDDPVFVPRMAKAFGARNGNYNLTLVPDAGQLLFFQQPEVTANAIVSLVTGE